jgi:hypothetical protein
VKGTDRIQYGASDDVIVEDQSVKCKYIIPVHVYDSQVSLESTRTRIMIRMVTRWIFGPEDAGSNSSQAVKLFKMSIGEQWSAKSRHLDF